MKVLVCEHRSYFYTLWENNRTFLLLQPRQGEFCVGVIQKIVVSKTKPAEHRDYWLCVKWLTLLERQATGRKRECSMPKDKASFFPSNRYVALFESARLRECRWIEGGSGAINSEVQVSLWCITTTDVECSPFFFYYSFCTRFQFLRQPDTSPSLHPILFYFSFACVSALAASSLIVLRLPRL